METIYPASNFSTTDKITNLVPYFKSYSKLCELATDTRTYLNMQQAIQNELSRAIGSDINAFEVTHIANLCGIDKLSVEGEIAQTEVHFTNKYTMKLQRNYDITENGKKLETVKAKLKFAAYQPRKKEFDNMILENKHSSLKEIIPGTEVVVIVRIYQPFDKKLYSRHDTIKCSQEIVTLGSQTLANLRDRILCANDVGYCVEVKNPNIIPPVNVKENYPSALICLDDVLYNDLRHPKAIDYSVEVLKWAHEKKICNFKIKHMNEVRINDLNFRFGYPYIYQHKGDCEHVIVFSDARLIKSSDSLCSSDYPYYRSVNRYNAEHCNICRLTSAKWMCIEADRLPHDRTFLCHDCHISYNFLNGERIGQFKAYPYFDKSLFV